MQYDIVVIGSGPGGYVAAIRCAQLGLKTAIIEKYDALGGTCLNVGCIPSKALLDSSEHYHNAAHAFATHGIKLDNLSVDIDQMMKRKVEVVNANTSGIAFLMKKNKIDVFHGVGSFKDKNTITIKKSDNTEEEITSQNVIIATGSKPFPSLHLYQNRQKTYYYFYRSVGAYGDTETPNIDRRRRDRPG